MILSIVFFLVLASCATPPTEEMNKARDAVTRAENDADAVSYAPNALIRARDALTRMQSESDAKRYDAAKKLAGEAYDNAERAIADGRSAAERARMEAVALINGLEGPLSETADNLDKAKEVEGIQLDFAVLSKDMASAYGTYNDAKASIQAHNYNDAIVQGETVRSILASINGRLTGGAVVASRKQ